MGKMSDSAQVRMNAALRIVTMIDLARVRAFDLTQAATGAIQSGVADIDARGLWRVRLEDPRTDDEEKRTLLGLELVRRGE